MQKRAPSGEDAPQDGQLCSSALPQDMQKRASGGFSLPHEMQPVPAI
jgi:hypothetical protein